MGGVLQCSWNGNNGDNITYTHMAASDDGGKNGADHLGIIVIESI